MSDDTTPNVEAAEPTAVDDTITHARRPRRVRELDFSRPMKLSPTEQRRFETAHATFCRDASMRLSSELRTATEFEVINFAQLTWTAAAREMPSLSLLAVVATDPLDTTLLFGIEEPFLLAMIERMLGGPDAAAPPPRTLTDIDMALARRLFDSLIETLSVSWQDLLGLRLRLVDVLPQHATVELVLPSEPTLALSIQVRHHSGAATMSLLVPYSSIEAVSQQLAGLTPAAEDGAQTDQQATGALRNAVGAVGVELRAEVGAIEMTISEVLALGEGDVVRIGPIGNEGIYGGEERLHRARPGRSGTRRAVQIIAAGGTNG